MYVKRIVCEHTLIVLDNSQNEVYSLQLSSHLVGEFNKFGDGKLLRTARHHLVFEELRRGGMITTENLTEGDTEHLSALVEDRLNHTTKQPFVTAQIRHLIACHPDNSTLHLGRRIEHVWFDGEEIFDIVPGLNQDRQDTILFVAWLRGHTKGHFMLDHTRTTGDEILVVEHLEEYLRGDVIRIVSCQHKLLSIENLPQVHPEEISTYYIIIQAGEMLTKIGHRLTVDFHHLEGTGFLHEILGHNTHTRSYLQYRKIRTSINGIRNGLGNIQISEKMLAEILLRTYLFHADKGTNK